MISHLQYLLLVSSFFIEATNNVGHYNSIIIFLIKKLVKKTNYGFQKLQTRNPGQISCPS